MTRRRLKTNVFFLEGFNAFATGIYFNWLFFFTHNRLHFGIAENLGLVALHGLVYTGAAWFGGWAERIRTDEPWKRELLAMERPTAPATVWLLADGWKRRGLLKFDERPG